MRKNFGPKPWTYPQPVLILATYGEDGAPDAMNAAWGGISEAREISVCISEGHKTTANILARNSQLMIFDEPEAGIDLWSFARLTETF